MKSKQIFSVAMALLLLTSGCSAGESATKANLKASTAEATQTAEAADTAEDTTEVGQKLDGAVEIEGAFNDGKMSASVGPLYRLDSGATVLALTGQFSKETTGWPANYSVGKIITSAESFVQRDYSGLYLLDNEEVFLPLTDKEDHDLWLPQDPKLDKKHMHPWNEKKKGGLKESVLIPFPKIDDSKQVGISVGLIGFAGDVPVKPISEAPKNIQAVVSTMEPTLDLEYGVHSPYTAVTETPGLNIGTSKKSLEVTLAADVFFDSGSWALKPESNKALDQLVQALTTHEPGEVEIVGHTDDVPDKKVGNQALSENRANAVKAAIEKRPELAGFTFKASGKGASEPANPGHDDKARAANRRVNILVKTPVKKEILEERALNSAPPAPFGEEATWPNSVKYDANLSTASTSKPEIMEISASKAVAYPNYTVVTYTITSKTLKSWLSRLYMDGYEGIDSISVQMCTFLGADILRGESRILPLKYEIMDLGKIRPRFITGGSTGGTKILVEENDKVTIPVVYPPTKDEKITIDVSHTPFLHKDQKFGWRIKDIPVVPATDSSATSDAN